MSFMKLIHAFPRRECKRTRRYPPDDHRVLKFLRVIANLKSSLTQPLLQNRPLLQAICPGSLWTQDNRWLLSRVQRLAGPAGGTWAFCPGWRHQPGQKALGPLSPSLSPPPEPFSSLVFLLFLARDRVLAHFFTTFVKIFDSPSIHRR